MKKIILFTLTLSVALFASSNYKTLTRNRATVTKNVSKYAKLLNNEANMSKFYKLKYKQNNDFIRDMTIKSYKGTKFLTKAEFRNTMYKVNKIKRYLNRKREVLLYFISESMPKVILYRILFQVGILQENGFNIETRQYFNGFGPNFKNYLMTMRQEINEKPGFERVKILRNAQIKVDPRFFTYFKLKKVPAMVLAQCTAPEPGFNTCKFQFLLRGDISLSAFFDKISKIDKKYRKYYNVLIANKFTKEVHKK